MSLIRKLRIQILALGCYFNSCTKNKKNLIKTKVMLGKIILINELYKIERM